MSQAFDKYEKLGAYHYSWYDDPNHAWYKVCVDKIVKFCKGTTLDFGCGDGLVLSKLPKYSIGIDIDTVALDICRAKQLSVTSSNSLISPINYLCCLNTIEHLKNPDILLKLIKSNVTKGAIIITDMPTENKGRYHEHEYTKEELLDTFAEFKPKYFVINSTEFGKPIQFHGVEIKK